MTEGHRQRLKDRFLGSLLPTGESSLPDYELLELVLFLSHPRGDVKPKAKMLLEHFKSFRGVLQAPREKLAELDGIGETTIAALKICQAGVVRLARQEILARPVFAHWQKVLDYCTATMGHLPIEQFRILFLNTQNALLADEVQQQGTVNQTPVYPREVVKRALALNAANLILVHNHPSGSLTPSQADRDLTHRIIQAAQTLDMHVLDHLIISPTGYYSFKEQGAL